MDGMRRDRRKSPDRGQARGAKPRMRLPGGILPKALHSRLGRGMLRYVHPYAYLDSSSEAIMGSTEVPITDLMYTA